MTQFNAKTSTTRTNNKLLLILVPILIIVAGILVLIALTTRAETPEKKPTITLAPLVEAMVIQPEDITFEVSSQGTVSPRTETILISEVSGMVTDVSRKLNVGGFFKKGELILTIDPIIYEVAVLEAESRVESMQALYIQEEAQSEQAEDEWLITGRPVSDAPILALRIPQLKKARADVKAAEADLKKAKIQLTKTKIIAPYDALITEKFVDIGQYVSTSSQVAKTIAIDYAEVRLPIKQKDIPFLNLPKVNQFGKVGSVVRIESRQGAMDLSWDSHITRYEGVVDSSSRVHYLVAQIDDPYNLLINDEHDNEQDAELRVGMFVHATVIGKTSDSILRLPRTALRGADQIHTIDNENNLNIVMVDVIRTDAKYVYIKNNINTDNRLVLTKLSTAIQGMPLRVKGDEKTNGPVTPNSAEVE